MPTPRRYVVRLYCKDRDIAGILEDPRTAVENLFSSARKLTSLLCKVKLTPTQSAQPTGSSSNYTHRPRRCTLQAHGRQARSARVPTSNSSQPPGTACTALAQVHSALP